MTSIAALNPDDVGYDVILLAGQSNMSGRGVEIDPIRFDPIDPRIFQWGNVGVPALSNMISQAVEPLNMIDVPRGMGPGLVFARWYLLQIPLNRRVLLVPAAKGEVPLVQIRPLSWNPTMPDDLYARAIRQTKNALAAAGPNARLTAILWVQGESDAMNKAPADVYREHLDMLINGLRRELNAPDVPFILGQQVPDYLDVDQRYVMDAVHVDTPRRITHSAFAYGPVGPQFNNGDRVHYNAAGQRHLGKAMFEALALARANTHATAPLTPSLVDVTQEESGTVTVSWHRPRCRFTDFAIRYSTTSGRDWQELKHTASLHNTVEITDLKPGESLVAQVATINEVGQSDWSASSTPLVLF